eukprot:TRINITY_DN8686_c0_g2_i1.p1 TRINITY_DN8686_c0_g2~~TRINITY_DN8686_c0_g2_i1.p1  ORF type:complete len:383 (-),score=102.30 TRINITY_DN8686_c0_g2_i1:23-1171(-)
MWEELVTARDSYKKGKLAQLEWFAKRDQIISSSKISEFAPNKGIIDDTINTMDELSINSTDVELSNSIITHLHTLSFDLFFWHAETLEERAANKAYFTKKKGLEKLMSLMKNENVDLIVKEYVGSCLWHYSELNFQRKKAAKHGLLDCVIYMLTSNEPILINKSLGILWAFLEYDDFQEKSISLGILEHLLKILGHDEYDQLNINGCLFSISSNAKCRPHLTQIVPPLLEYFNAEEEIELGYLACLTLANMFNDKKLNLNESDLVQAKELIATFLSLHTPQEMRACEEANCYTWVSFVPFLDLTFSEDPQIQQLGLFSLANITSSDINREIIHKNGISDDVITASLFIDHPYSQMIFNNCKPFTTPSLKAIILRKFPNLRQK